MKATISESKSINSSPTRTVDIKMITDRVIGQMRLVMQVNPNVAITLLNFYGNLSFLMENMDCLNPADETEQVSIHQCRNKFAKMVRLILTTEPEDIVKKIQPDLEQLKSHNIDMYEKVEIVNTALYQ